MEYALQRLLAKIRASPSLIVRLPYGRGADHGKSALAGRDGVLGRRETIVRRDGATRARVAVLAEKLAEKLPIALSDHATKAP